MDQSLRIQASIEMQANQLFGLDELVLNEPPADTLQTAWANLGYWPGADTYPQAAKKMATLIGDALELSPHHTLLDVGFGLGEQLLLWLSHYQVSSVVGYNPSTLQSQYAQEQLDARGLSKRATLHPKPARAISEQAPLQFDRVIALDSAYHFESRAEFIKQAKPLLCPGGKLGIIDILPTERALKGLGRIVTPLLAKAMYIPRANLHTIAHYQLMTAQSGFKACSSIDITEAVFPGFCAHILENTPQHRHDPRWRKMRISAALLSRLHEHRYIQAVMVIASA